MSALESRLLNRFSRTLHADAPVTSSFCLFDYGLGVKLRIVATKVCARRNECTLYISGATPGAHTLPVAECRDVPLLPKVYTSLGDFLEH